MSNTDGASVETDEKGGEAAKVCTFFKKSGRHGGGGRRKRPVHSAAADDDDAGVHHWGMRNCVGLASSMSSCSRAYCLFSSQVTVTKRRL